jgi:hypothetical protein
VVSFNPMHHWNDQKIRVHVVYCVLALARAQSDAPPRRTRRPARVVRELLAELADISQTVLL